VSHFLENSLFCSNNALKTGFKGLLQALFAAKLTFFGKISRKLLLGQLSPKK